MANKSCLYCGTTIPTEASVCHVCKYYQRAWRNNLLFAGSLAGLTAIVVSAIFFIIDQSKAAYKNLVWKDQVAILSLKTGIFPHFETTLLNSGDGAVFATDLVVYWRGKNVQYSIKKTINPHEFLSIAHDDPYLGLSPSYRVIGNNSGKPTDETIRNVDILEGPGGKKPCFVISALDKNATDLKRMTPYYESHGMHLVLEEAEAEISYVSSRTGKIIRDRIEIVVTFSRLDTEECRKIPFEYNR